MSVRFAASGSYHDATAIEFNGGKATATITLTEDATGIQLYFGSGSEGVGEYIILSNIQLELGSSATNFAPYSNECPISGHTGCEVVRTGKNLYDLSDTSVVRKLYPGSGDKLSSSENTRSIIIPCEPNTTYTVSKKAGSRFQLCYIEEEPKANVTFYGRVTDNTGTVLTITTGANAEYLIAYVWYKTQDQSTIPLETMLASVNICEAYTYTTVAISFGQTVYGGQLTVNEDGTGTVKARPYYASYNGETLVGPWVSSMDAYAPGTTPTTGAQVVDMGGTETTISLTPGQVNALQGNNTVWVDDSGEIKVTYRSN